jgi:hypothetical protein
MKHALFILLALASCGTQANKNLAIAKANAQGHVNFVITNPPEPEMVFVEGGDVYNGK